MEAERSKVFARDPFAVDPLPRAHYHPSPEKRLTRNQRQTSISPSRQAADSRISKNVEESRLSPMDEIFLRNTNSFQPKMTSHYIDADDDDDGKFDESWPSSERPSSMNLTGFDEESPVNMERFKATVDKYSDLKKTLSYPEHESPGTSPQIPRKKDQKKTVTQSKSQIPVRNQSKGKVMKTHQEDPDGGSVLQRYIERFRSSAPLSREERERLKETEANDFWWLSSSQSPAVTPSGSGVPEETDQGGKNPAEYIERFRSSAPLSREERERLKETEANDFWWLSSSQSPAVAPPGSGVPEETDRGGKKSSRVTPLTTVNLDKYSHIQKLKQNGYQKPTDIPPSPGDKKTRELQERAEKLLERSSSSVMSTEPAVSTDGLGSNTSGMSSLEEYSYRPKFAHFLDKEDQSQYTANPYTYKSEIPTKPVRQSRPEDDPLHQWRLRRRMEQAQEAPPTNVQSFGFLAKTEQQKKIDSQLNEFKRKLAGKETGTKTSKPSCHSYQFTQAPSQEQVSNEDEPHIASPTLHRRKPRTESDSEVDPHLHLMCDLLPCPHRGKYDDNLQAEKTSKEGKIDQRKDSQSENRKEFYSDNRKEFQSDIRKEFHSDNRKEFHRDNRKEFHSDDRKEFQSGNGKEFQSDTIRDKIQENEFLSPRETYNYEKRTKYGDSKIKDKEIMSDYKSDINKQGKDGSKYKQFLEAEKPDIENRSDSDRSMSSDKSRKGKDKVKAKKANARKSDTEDIDSDAVSKELRQEKEQGRSTDAESSRKSDGASESDTHPDNNNKGKGERSRSRELKKDKLRPRLSSSPKSERKVVDDAIGQVVKNHLFSMSTSTVLSSVESLPPTASVEGLPRVPEHTAEEQGKAGLEEKDEDDIYETDGEFQEDHLLQMLRKQRAQYELQLREIDAALSSLENR